MKVFIDNSVYEVGASADGIGRIGILLSSQDIQNLRSMFNTDNNGNFYCVYDDQVYSDEEIQKFMKTIADKEKQAQEELQLELYRWGL